MKKNYDWEAVGLDYRAGILSLRQLTKKHGPSTGAIRKQAKRHGWTRDLLPMIQQAAQSKLNMDAIVHAQEGHSGVHSEIPSVKEQEIVEVNAVMQAALIRDHRAVIGRVRIMVESMLDALSVKFIKENQLKIIIRDMSKLEECEETDQSNRRKYQSSLKLLGIAADAITLESLSRTLKTLIYLERQAFSISENTTGNERSYEDALKALMDSPYTDDTGRVIDVNTRPES